MNALLKSDGTPVTMTSLELVEFINSQRTAGESELRHDHFMAKVPKVLGDEHAPKFRDMLQIVVGNGATRQSPIFRFPKREACLMAMSYSYDLQAKVFDRMTALEAQPVPTALNMRDPKQLVAAALQLIEVNQELQSTIDQQQQKIEADAPKVEALERIAMSDGSLCLTDAAKTLQVQPRQFTQLLQQKAWIYRRPMGAGWLGYQDRIQSGHLEHKVTTGEKSDGREWTNTQVRITPKGLTKLAQVIHQAGLH